MTWTEVAPQSTVYENPTDSNNLYVVLGYLQNDYIEADGMWVEVDYVVTSWV